VILPLTAYLGLFAVNNYHNRNLEVRSEWHQGHTWLYTWGDLKPPAFSDATCEYASAENLR
jgi:hypothetical protein